MNKKRTIQFATLLIIVTLSIVMATRAIAEVVELEGTTLSEPGSISLSKQASGSKPGLAVIPFSSSSERFKAFCQTLSESLLSEIETQDYELYEQAQLAKVYKYLQQTQADLYNQQNVLKQGMFKKAGYLLLGKLDPVGGQFVLNAKLVDAQTSRIIKKGKWIFASETDAVLRIDWVAYELSLRSEQPKTPPTDIEQLIRMSANAPIVQQANGQKTRPLKEAKKAWPISIDVTPKKAVYDESDEIQFVVNSSQDCYVTLIQVDPKGNTTLLLPNDYAPSARVRAGRPTMIPNDLAGFLLAFGEPHGVTHVKAIATKHPIRLESAGQQLKKLGPFTALGNLPKSRAIKIKARSEKGEWSWAELNVRSVKDRSTYKGPMEANFNFDNAVQPARPQVEKVVKKSLKPAIMPNLRANDQVAQAWQANSRSLLQASPIFMETGTPLAASEIKKTEFIVLSNVNQRFGELMTIKAGSQPGIQKQGLSEQAQAIKAQAKASIVIPNRKIKHFADQPLPISRYGMVQWALKNQAHPGNDIGWHRVQDQVRQIQGSLVGVVDSGINTSDLRLRTMCWRNPNEFSGNGLDDDRNGYADDIYGANIANPGQPLFNAKTPFHHGSFVSSIIGARFDGSNNSMIGLSPNSQIVSANVFAANGSSTTFDVLKGIAYCMDIGAKVINLSLGQDMPWAEINQIHYLPLFDELERRGVILVVAAGNSNKDIDKNPVFPASLNRSNIITVMAIDPSGQRGHALAPIKNRPGVQPFQGGGILQSQKIEGFSGNTVSPAVAGTHRWKPYSNYGRKTVELAAPGSMILGVPSPGKFAVADGTSYAAPMVTAAVSLIQGKHPNWDHKTVIRAVLETVKPVTSLRFECKTGGTLDLAEALNFKP